MTMSIKIAVTTVAAALLATVTLCVGLSAQSGREAPAVPENATTIPLKVVTREYDKKELLNQPALSQEAFAGRVLWLQRCAYCHDGVGQPSYKTMGPWIDSDTVKAAGAEALKVIINTGTANMPGFKYDMDDSQINDVIEFLKTVPASAKPTAAQLAGKAPAADGSD